MGGIFFDDFDEKAPLDGFAFASACGASFVASYVPLVQRRKDTPFTAAEKHWQQLRRGRCVMVCVMVCDGV